MLACSRAPDGDIELEKEQLLAQLQQVKSLLPMSIVDWNTDSQLVYHAPASVRYVAAWRRWFRGWWSCLKHLLWLLGLSSLSGWGALIIAVQTFMVILYSWQGPLLRGTPRPNLSSQSVMQAVPADIGIAAAGGAVAAEGLNEQGYLLIGCAT